MNKNWYSPAKTLMLGMAVAGTLLLTSCDKDDDDPVNNMYTISGSGTGAQVVPPFAGTGTGTISGTYNKETNQLDYNVGWNGLTETAATVGFYKGATGAAGDSVQSVTITTDGITGNSTGNMTLSEAQEMDLLNGNMYYSIGTTTNPGGEVRGQITATQ